MLALLAVSTPFWLFNSDQSIAKNHNTTTNTVNHGHVVTDKPNAQGVTGTIDLNSLNNEPSQDNSQASSPTKDLVKEQGSDANQGLSEPIVDLAKVKAQKESKARKLEEGKAKEQAKSEAKEKDSSKDKDAAQSEAQEQGGSKTKDIAHSEAQEQDSNKVKEQDKSARPDGQSEQSVTNKEQNEPNKQSTAPNSSNQAQDSNKITNDQSLANKDSKVVDDKSKVVTKSLEENNLQEQVIATKEELKSKDNNLTLAQKVKAITEAQTKEQKEEYHRSIEKRQEMVNAAIASIAQNSKMYLPPLISSRALVVTFSVPVANAYLSSGKDHGLDATTGATIIKHDNKVDGAMSFIAQRLSKESGADLYYITPTIAYPKNRNQLYQFALNELTDKSYPELTDDVPLNLDKYDTIYLCYPIWWDDMPAAIYSFLIKYDLSDKNIIPVCLHSGDDFANTLSTITTYEPHALIYKKGLSISTKESLNSNTINNRVRAFLSKLSCDFN